MLTLARWQQSSPALFPSRDLRFAFFNMNLYGEDVSCCYFHPKEMIVGVCALCLKERLLILASKQGHIPVKDTKRTRSANKKKPPVTLSRIFDLGSILHLLEFQHNKSDISRHDTLTGLEDSFISIKFEDNGVASWDKGASSKVPPLETFNMSYNRNLNKEPRVVKSVVEHAKPRAMLKWQKRIGHLFQLIRWKRSSKANMCHAGSKVERVKVKKGWIRVLTRRSME
ncbi:hypothetical protein NE237_017919 [Protea cynaroides]|uniref:Uncharacterized protein n=1 Tax=Protea cynaroides TaxID=273540 RepID=A0A9Q0QNF8_9MAGN|nr:hypothetical protein NE237_017919 [Protea cynaroides]